jgi:hypothetical protein
VNALYVGEKFYAAPVDFCLIGVEKPLLESLVELVLFFGAYDLNRITVSHLFMVSEKRET